MNRNAIIFFLGYILRLEAVFLFPALLIALYQREWVAAHALSVTILLAAAFSIATLVLKKKDRTIAHREGFVIVSLAWVVMSLVGAMPFTLSGYIYPQLSGRLF